MIKQSLFFYAFWVIVYTLLVHVLSYKMVESGRWRTGTKDLEFLKKFSPII
jgi:hypothetical protein